MDYRNIALRILIVSLCIAGLSGVVILFLPSTKFINGRLIATAILTSVAAASLLIAIKGIESSVYRPLGLAASVLIFLVYAFGGSAIWTDLINSSDISEQLTMSAFITLGCGAVILIGTACFRYKQLAIAGKVLVCFWVLILLTWLNLTWLFRPYLFNNDSILYVLVPIQFYSALFALLLVNKRVWLKTIGESLAAISCSVVIVGLLKTQGDIGKEPGLLLLALATAFVSSVMAFWNIIIYRKPEQKMPRCEAITLLVVGIAIGSFCSVIWYSNLDGTNSQPPELIVRLSSGFGILALTGLFTLVIGRTIRTNTFLRPGTSQLHSPCPRCANKLLLSSGHSNCQHCGFSIHLKMDSAGCRNCNYDLSGSVNIDVCPECGVPIAINTTVE
ncbi:MAG TPA: hypothetical protein EYO01_00470 [Phycisphaerales bacterium]|nr:hypothetical protein [Phycisphaerales bacterium]HIB49854.1 hypothetical protein [Phycisphaerales bacterium]HIN84316.1 hypothetical protein [Phycisphaerales bacterium]